MNRIRYRIYRPAGLAITPPAPTADQADHVPSGVAVLPVLVSMIMLVFAGSVAVHAAAPQFTTRPASNTDDVNIPPEVYEAIRTQSAFSGWGLFFEESVTFIAVPELMTFAIVFFSTPSM